MEKSIFKKHPSQLLNELYSKKSYQGANPIQAKILFVGKDPNWALNIEELSIFELVAEYLTDGAKFWKKHKIHHPFLHPNYKEEGKKYHQAISRINLSSDISENISFLEIIGFPTYGMSSKNNKQFYEYLLSVENRQHLIELDKLFNNSEKLIFLYWGLIDCLKIINKKTGLFNQLAKVDKNKMIRTDLNKFKNFYIHKHFSMGISPKTLAKIYTAVNEKINTNNHL